MLFRSRKDCARGQQSPPAQGDRPRLSRHCRDDLIAPGRPGVGVLRSSRRHRLGGLLQAGPLTAAPIFAEKKVSTKQSMEEKEVETPDHVALFENSPKVPIREITKLPRALGGAVFKNESENDNKYRKYSER